MTTPTNTAAASVAADLRAAAQAVVDRWDTPTWKDAPATEEYIGRLRAALAAPAQPAPANAGKYPQLPKALDVQDPHGVVHMYDEDQMRAYVDADRAARGAAQAAPVDAAKLPSPANVGTAPKCLNLNDQAMWVLGWNECLDAARAAQKGGAV